MKRKCNGFTGDQTIAWLRDCGETWRKKIWNLVVGDNTRILRVVVGVMLPLFCCRDAIFS